MGQNRDARAETTSSATHARQAPTGTLSRRAILRAAGIGVRGFALAGVLAACGTGTSQPAAAPGTVKFVDNSNSSQQPRVQGYISAFQKSSGIAVSLVSIENYYTSNIEAMVSAGVPPDVLFVSRAEYDALFPVNKLADLQPYLQSSPQSAPAFFPIALAEWQHSGKQYAMPLGIRTQAVAFNVGLFAQNKLKTPPTAWTDPGWTIPDFSNGAFAASQAGTASQDPNYGFYVDPVYLVWSAFVINAGGTVVNEQNRTIDVDQPPAIEALTVLQNVMLKPGVLPPNDLVSADGGIDLFANGNLAMTITDSSTIGSRQRQSHFLWDTGVMPSGAGGRFTTGTGAGYALVVGSKNADKAWKLVDYLTGDAVQKQEAPVGEWIPSRSAVANSAAFLPEMNNVDLSPQHARVFVDAISANKVKLQPALANWQAVRAALEAGIQGLWTGALTPAAAAAQMKKLAEPILKQG
ncbi:MAG TPA: extracellular solute-binding protein [Chloroflexota bacterium]